MKKRFYQVLIAAIILLGGFLRLYNLSNSPPSLNWDEAALGYNAYSISKTLKDEYGALLPVFTRSFDEYKSTLPLYLMIPTIKMFGLNEVGVRFPSAFLGTLTILLVYLLALEIFKNKRIAALSALLISVEPWAVHLSRVYQEASVALFFLLLGFLLYLYSKKRSFYLPLSVLSLMLSMYTYNSNKLLVPLVIVGLFILDRKKVKKYPKKIKRASVGILLFFVLPFIYLAFKGEVFARVSSTHIFNLWPTTNVLRSFITDHNNLAGALDFILHNKYYYFGWELVGRYLSYFSPANLFLREPLEPATILAGNSIFHPFEFIPWLIGLSFLVLRTKKYPRFSLFVFLSPIPAILTWNWFQPGRVMALLAAYSILIAIGIERMVEFFTSLMKKYVKKYSVRPILYFAVSVYVFISAFYVFDAVNVQLPVQSLGNWQPGFRETVPLVMELSENYDQVIIETSQAQPYIFYLFYGKYSPDKYLQELDLEKIGTPRKVYDFGKLVFRKINWDEDKNLKKTLLVGNEFNLPFPEAELEENLNFQKDIKSKEGYIISRIVGLK